MGRIRQKHTAPELAVRSVAHREGMRFSFHDPRLPGRPDLVLPARRLVIFVHGCFWHRHAGCSKTTTPKTNAQFWCAKFQANVKRDARNIVDLRKLGWNVAVIWECQTLDVPGLQRYLRHLATKHPSNDPARLSRPRRRK
jgi:DNA mismatch endonuclease, patch repair protein